jgi:hypothetical protein
MSDVGKSTKRLVKSGLKAAYDPVGGTKDSFAVLKDDWGDVTGKTAAKARQKKADEEAAQLRAEQAKQLAELNSLENDRIKKLLYSGRVGLRGYRGGPLFRARPSNTAGAGGRSGGASAAGGGAVAAATSAALAANGVTGGLLRGSTKGSSFRAVRES